MTDTPKTTDTEALRERLLKVPGMAERIEKARAQMAAYRAAHGGRLPIKVEPFHAH